MYIYFDEAGTLKEIITERVAKNGDSKSDKLHIFWAGEHAPQSGWVKFRKPDGTETAETQFFAIGDALAGKELPSEPKRNLDYFSYDHTYEADGERKSGYLFYEVTVPDEVLSSASTDADEPAMANLCVARARFAFEDGSVKALGAIAFSVEASLGILSDSSIDESQYNYLIALISEKIGAHTSSEKLDALPESGETGVIYYVKSEKSDLVYDAYFWTGENFAWLGTTAYGLYTPVEGKEFEDGLKALWKAEFAAYTSKTDSTMEGYGNLIKAAASGSPKGTYATVDALKSAYPSGTSGIYVVLADGKWYYWSGSAWTAGGTYLSTADAVPASRKIAELTLENDISAQSLTDSLVMASDDEIKALFE